MTVPLENLQIFKLFGNVLNDSVESYSRGKHLTLETAVPKIEAAIQHMKREYRGGQCPDFSFEDDWYRLAYMYEYASANSLAVLDVLSSADKNNGISGSLLGTESKISICSLGGGPGSEIVGIAKWIARQQLEIEQLEVVVTDKTLQWRTEWKRVLDALNNNFRSGAVVSSSRSPFVVSRGYVSVDVEDPTRAQIQALRAC